MAIADVRFGLVAGPLLLCVGFLLFLIGSSYDDYVDVSGKTTTGSEFTNRYGVYTAFVDGAHGNANGAWVLVNCKYGVAQTYDTDETSTACRSNCNVRKTLVVLALFFIFTACMYTYDSTKMEVVSDKRHRFVSGLMALMGCVFVLVVLSVIGAQMHSEWNLPSGSASTITSDYGVCDYKMNIADFNTLTSIDKPEMGISMKLGIA